MTAGEAWFTVRPGAQRKGKVIKIPLTYTGQEVLSRAEVTVFGDHILGVSSEHSEYLTSEAELGDLATGAEFWLTIQTDDEPGHLKFTLDLIVNKSHVRKLRVEAPPPVSVPVVTEHPEC